MSSQTTGWQCGAQTLALDRPLVMGILNVTPDSFSDGGAHEGADAAVAHGLRMVAEGADIVDVGGESTRPGSDEVSPELELARVLPVVRELAARQVVVSVDTRHASVAQACVEAGAAIINDVSGFRDPAMVEVAQGCAAGLVVMHMQGEPRRMQERPYYEDVVREVSAYLSGQALMLEGCGVAHERICLDPGVGFGKTFEHNRALIRATEELASLGWPLMVAVSRKRFIGELSGVDDPSARVAGSVACAAYAVARGAAVARVHDVAATAQALRTVEALRKP